MIFDTHAHYDSDAFDEDRDTLLASMQAHGVGHIVNACASVEDIPKTIALMEQYPFLYGAVGVHPDDADKITSDVLEQLRSLCRHEKTVAVGEIGLDYYWHKEKAEHLLQQEMFRAQMDIAREEKLPFMIHSREAAEDTLNIVREYMQGGMYGQPMNPGMAQRPSFRCDKCGWVPEDPNNIPRFCPECGDPFDQNDMR